MKTIRTIFLLALLPLIAGFARNASAQNSVFLSSNAYSVNENAGSAALVVQVTRAAGNQQTITVDYATSDGTAQQGSDYFGTSGTLTFAPNETAKLVQVAVIDDSISEPTEAFTFRLTNAVNATITGGTATVTINDNDGSANGINVIEFTSVDYGAVETLGPGQPPAAITFVLTAQRRGDPNQPLTVDLNIGQNGDTAQNGRDYSDNRDSPTVTFPPGIDRVTVNIPVIDRPGEAQGNTFFTATLTNPGDFTSIGQRAVARSTIFDNSGPNTVQLLARTFQVRENSQASIAIPVFRTGAYSNSGTRVNFTTEIRPGDTARAGVNFTPVSGSITFNLISLGLAKDNEHQGFIVVSIPDNTALEGDVTFHVTLTSSDVAQLGAISTTQVTVEDDDSGNVVQFSNANFSVSEEGPAAVITVKLTPNGDPSRPSIVDFSATPITAFGGFDFSPISTTVVFQAGETTKTVLVPIMDDSITEFPETFRVTLSNPGFGTVLGAQSTSVVTILDNDLSNVVQISPVEYSVAENAGPAKVTVVVDRANHPDEIITVNYQTQTNTATSADFGKAAPASPLVFAGGETEKTITIPIVDDNLIEGAENFLVTLTSASAVTQNGMPASASVGTNNTATITIADDDSPAATIGFSQDTFNADEGAGGALLTVTRSGGLGVAATINYSTSDGTARAGVNYVATSDSITFRPGESSKTIRIPLIDDPTPDPTLTFTVTLTAANGTGFVGGRAQATINIIDNDATTFRFNPATYVVDEGSGSATLTVEALRVGDTNTTISVDFVTGNQTATAGANFVRTSGRLTFGPSVSSRTISVPIIDNGSTDGNTTFVVTLSNPLGDSTSQNPDPRLGSPATATVTIIDNDATTFQFSSDTFTANNRSGVANATVTLSRVGDPNKTYSVSYDTSNLSALAGRDYRKASGKLTFGPGVSSRTISVPLIKQPVGSPTRQFRITLSKPTNGAFLGTQASTIIEVINPDLSTKPVNISTRGLVQGGEGVMIAGFIIQGNSPKKVIVRGLGPSLLQRGVVGPIMDPTLDLRDGRGNQVAFDDDFNDSQAQEIAATNLPPDDDREAAIVATLPPGNYTAILRGKTDGIGQVEVYDLQSTSATHLVNISTRATVGPNDNSVLIGGFIIEGEVAQQVLLRAIGPSLGSNGVSGALADPTLDFYRGSQLILSNDDWKSDNEAAIRATGIAPSNDKEAALLINLDPGSYTAVVRGKNGTTGVSLVEVYQMP